MDAVTYERVGVASLVTIDRPHRRNAIDGPIADALVVSLDRFEADDEARVLVLTGAGEAFCAGADLTALETLSPRLLAGEGPLGFTRRVPTKPTVAAIDGWAVAGGLELALWCDLRIASERARFGCLERRFGVPLVDGGTWRLPRVVGFGRALDLILTGRRVRAAEALAIGLCDRVVADGTAREAAESLAREIARFPQLCLRADRAAVLRQQDLPLREALRQELQHGLAALRREGLAGAARFAGGRGRHGAADHDT
jgi:enoyl-CoA hydratase